MIKPKFRATVTKRGDIAFLDWPTVSGYLKKFTPGQELDISIGPKFKRRTQGDPGEDTNFNGYYWAVPIRMISDEMGEIDDNVTHNLLQMMFNKKGVVVGVGIGMRRNIEVPRGTKDLSGMEFAEYCSKIRIWAAIPKDQGGLGIYVPEPHEAEYGER